MLPPRDQAARSFFTFDKLHDHDPAWTKIQESLYEQITDPAIRQTIGVPVGLDADYQRRYANSRLGQRERRQKNFADVMKALATAIPFFGQFAGNLFNRLDTEMANYEYNRKQTTQSIMANRYNSPRNQMRRMMQAGINPFYAAGMVKNMPYEAPAYQPLSPYMSPVGSPVSPMEVANYFQRERMNEARIDNLSSLTDINTYKEEMLYPQIFAKNGYMNDILLLQSDWAKGNYDYQQQVLQNMLDVKYMHSLALLGEEMMRILPHKDNTKIIVDAYNGTILFQERLEDGTFKNYDLSELSFDELPTAYQELLYNVSDTHQLRQADISLRGSQKSYTEQQEATSSVLATVYNQNARQLRVANDQYQTTGTWPTDDYTIRAAAGAMPWSTLIGSDAYSLGLRAMNVGVDVGKFAATKGIESMFQTPQVMPMPKVPKGARPFIKYNDSWNGQYTTPYQMQPKY